MRKPIIAAALAAVMAFTLCLAGCSSNDTLDITLSDSQTLEGMTFDVSSSWNQVPDADLYESAAASTEFEMSDDDSNEVSTIIDVACFPIDVQDVAGLLAGNDDISDMEYSEASRTDISDDQCASYSYSCSYKEQPCGGCFAIISAPNGQYTIDVKTFKDNGDDYSIKLVNMMLETVDIDNSHVVITEPSWHVHDAVAQQSQDNPTPVFSTSVVAGDTKSVTIQCVYDPATTTDATGSYTFTMISLKSDMYVADDGSPNGFEGCPIIVKVDDTQYDYFYSQLEFTPQVPKTVTFSMADGSDLPDTIIIQVNAKSTVLNDSTGQGETEDIDGKIISLRYS